MIARTASDTAPPVVALVQRARSGDQRAWDAIVELFTPLLWTIARRHRLPADDCADAVQVTWLRCVQYLDRIRSPARIGAWLATTCRHECLLLVRQRGRQIPHDTTDPIGPLGRLLADDHTDEVPDRLTDRQTLRVLSEAIAGLPERQPRILLALVHADADGRRYVDVAEAIGVPVGSLGPTRQRAVARLRSDPRVAARRT